MRTILTLLVFATPIQAQQLVKVKLYSGTVIVGTTNLKELPVQTRYGLLKIPLQEVLSINVGLHYDDDLKEKIEQAVKDLSSSVYKTRETAETTLVGYHKYSLPLLKVGADLETNKRLVQIKEKILEKKPFSSTYLPHDILKTDSIEVRGQILLSSIEISHTDFNSVKIKISSIKEIITLNSNQEIIQLKSNGWYKCKVYSEKVSVTASGSIEFWPSTPGNYIAGPSGKIGTSSRNMPFPIGTLIGKIGESGAAFYIGEKSTINKGTQDLFITVGNPVWDERPQGFYHVIIKGE